MAQKKKVAVSEKWQATAKYVSSLRRKGAATLEMSMKVSETAMAMPSCTSVSLAITVMKPTSQSFSSWLAISHLAEMRRGDEAYGG